MATRKPKPDFEIRMVGPGLRPWVVPISTLSRALQAVQRLLDKRGEEVEEEQDGQDEAGDIRVLHLIGLKSGSAAYSVASDYGDAAVHELRLTGSALNDPLTAEWTPALLSSVENLSKVARSLGCEIEFRLPAVKNVQGEVLAQIGPKSFEDISEHVFARGTTSIYAKLERVGGATKMHCGIRIPSQSRKMVICRVASADLVREMGRYLYEYVVLTGKAEWVRQNWHVRSMYITSIEAPKKGSFVKALDDIHRAGGSAWDEIEDPEEALRTIRGEQKPA